MLNSGIEALAMDLLPAGKRKGGYWTVGSVAGEPGGSLFIHLSGPRRGKWTDAATGEFGDGLDLLAACHYRGDRKAAYAAALVRLGLDTSGTGVPRPAPRETPPAKDPAPSNRSAAIHMWLSARETLRDTPVAAYLAARGIDLAELTRQPRCLRFHPALWNRESGRSWPAMVAAISDAAGVHVATHRTWLQQNRAGRWIKARLEDPKMVLGTYGGGTIRLWRGASRKPLADAPEGDAVIIAEGIEDGLSCALCCPELRVLAAVSLANMARVVLPPAVRTVILAADNDGDNEAATAQLQRAADHFILDRRVVKIARSPVGKDFNDLLTAAAT
jgi:Toprim domain